MFGAGDGHGDGWRVFKGVSMDSIVGVGGGVDGGVSTCVDSNLGIGVGEAAAWVMVKATAQVWGSN